MALRDVASQINSDGDLDAVLSDLIRAACVHGSWDLGAIMTVDAAHGYALVVARHGASSGAQLLEDRWELATSPAQVALRSGESVYIRDARESSEFPGYRRDALERGYCTVLMLPMTCADEEGRPMVLAVESFEISEPTPEDLAFMALIVHLGSIAIERAHRQRAQVAAAEQLRRALVSQGSLLREVLAGGSIESLTGMLSDLLRAPVVTLDFFGSRLLGSASPVPDRFDGEAWRQMLDGALGRQILLNVRKATAHRRSGAIVLDIGGVQSVDAWIEPVIVDDEAVGALLIFGEPERTDLQQLTVESARFALSVQLIRSVIRFRFETRTLTELFFEIVERRWRDELDLINRARRLGLLLTTPMRMLVVELPGGSDQSADLSAEAHRTVTLLAAERDVAVNVVTVGWGLVCLVSQDSGNDIECVGRLANRIADLLGRAFGCTPIVVVGETCTGPEAIAKEWERCWRMIRIARTFGRSGAIGVPDLGPLPMLIGAADSVDVRNFIDGAIGKVVEHDRKHGSSYLDTLAAYVRSGCRSQHCADSMGLHVTSLRYRLTRIADLFGIEVGTPEERFAIELALKLHNLIENSVPVEPN
jgi:DNA-binding PucR family transcriptional regulator